MAHDHDHDEESAHECGKCGQSFESEDALMEHAQESHDMDV
jgi:uncharacterized C2H2 Zn-finger protein